MKLQRVGDYLLGEKLGEGSFAKVRVGLHVMSREKVSELFYLFDSAQKKRALRVSSVLQELPADYRLYVYIVNYAAS